MLDWKLLRLYLMFQLMPLTTVCVNLACEMMARNVPDGQHRIISGSYIPLIISGRLLVIRLTVNDGIIG